MGIIDVLWSVGGGACLTLGLLHFLVWLQRRNSTAHLLFALAAAAAALNAWVELVLLNATTVEGYARALRLEHFPIVMLVVCLVWFIEAYLAAGRRWLAWVVTIGWIGVLVINLFQPSSIVFARIDEIRQATLPWGGTFTQAIGPLNRWKWLPDLLTPVFLLFVAEASWSAWRRGDRRHAVVAGGSTLVFMGLAGIHSPLVDAGVIESPYLITFAFLAVVVAMGLELSQDVVRSAELAEEVQASERRWRTLLEEVDLLVVGFDRDGRITYANPSAQRVTGFDASELLRETYTRLLPSAEVGTSLERFRRIMAGEPTRRNEILVRTKTGDERIVSWLSVVINDPDGQPAGLLGIGADLTRQRQAEAERETAAREVAAALEEVKALKSKLEEEVVHLREEVGSVGGFDEIIGESDTLQYVLHRVAQVAPLDTNVLVEGETGVGKELVARAIHRRSRRASRPLVTVNCAALPASLIETELFGHERGAFTGAVRTRRGRFELADGGTLFLDEVGEIPLELQAKLLRAIQDGQIERVGGDRTISVNVRIVAATNRELRTEVDEGRFREDLFYRLHVYPITVPALRQRKSDIPLLVPAIVRRLAKSLGRRVDQVPQAVLDELMQYDWPGNVRELESVIEQAVITSPDRTLRLAARLPNAARGGDDGAGVHQTLDEVERDHIEKVLGVTAWRIEGKDGAAERLGLHPNTLRSRMRKLGVSRPTNGPPEGGPHGGRRSA